MKTRERGAVAVEFALVMPVLLLVLLGMIDFGRAMFVKNSLAHAASVGAQALSIRSVDTVTTTSGGVYTDTASVGYLAQQTANGSGVMGMAGVSSQVTVTAVSTCPADTSTASYSSSAQVKVSIPFKWISPATWFAQTNQIASTATWLCVFTK